MAEGEWGDWAGGDWAVAASQQPAAAQQHYKPDQGDGVRQELPADMFSCGAENSEWGDFAPAAPAAPQPAQQHPQQPQEAAFAKGALAWYHCGRSGAWLEAVVLSVDQTIQPPSFGVRLPDGGVRETEQHRLRPRQPGAPPPGGAAAAAAAPANGSVAANAGQGAQPAAGVAAAASPPEPVEDDSWGDDFGDFAAAEPAPPAPAPALTPVAAVPIASSGPFAGAAAAGGAAAAAAAAAAAPSPHGSPERLPSRRSSGPPSPMLDSFRSFLRAAAPQVEEQLEHEDEEQAAHQAGGAQRQRDYGSLQQFAAAHLPASPRSAAPASGGAGMPAGPFPADGPFAGGAAAAGPPAAIAAAAAAAAAPELDADDFGSFAAAEEPEHAQPSQQQQQQQQQAAAAGVPAAAAVPGLAGDRRAAPLPLDLFGEEPAEDVPLEPLNLATPAAAAAAAAAPLLPIAQSGVVPNGQQQEQQEQQQPAAPQPDAAAAVDGWGDDDNFADFVAPAPAPVAAAAAVDAARPLEEAPAAPAAEQQPDAAAVEPQPAAAELEAEGWNDDFDGLPEQPEQQQQADQQQAEHQPEAAELLAACESDGHPEGLLRDDTASALAGQGLAVPPALSQPGSAAPTPKAAAAAAAAGTDALSQPLQQPASPASAGSAGSRQSALLSVLHPVSSRGSSARSSFEAPKVATPAQAWPALPAAPLSSAAAAVTAAAAAAAAAAAPGAGEEAVQEYAVAWARLLEAAARELRAAAALWAEAGAQGCWQELQRLPAAQQHLAACGQLYCAAAIVRLAAQQLGLLSLVGELQDAWAQAEAAWQSVPPADSHSGDGGSAVEPPEAEQPQQPAFREAVLAADVAGGALPLLRLLEGAPARLEALGPDDFPRLLAWSEGLCGLTLLPLSLFEGQLPAAPWLDGRPCLVPLANLWLHRVSRVPPQLD